MGEIRIFVEGGGASEEELYQLREELVSVRGVQAERAVEGDAPSGSKSIGIELAALAVKAGIGAMPEVVTSVASWLTRQRPGTKVRLEKDGQVFEAEGAFTAAQLDALIAKLG